MRAGLATVLTEGQTLMFHMGKLAAKEPLIAALDEVLREYAAADSLVLQLRQQRYRIRQRLPDIASALNALEAAVKMFYGADGLQLPSFGMKRNKPRRKLKGSEQVVANARKLETRKIRSTMGKKQKAKLKAGR